jgi:type I restriction enzyme S subunit
MTMHGGLVDQSSKFRKRVASEDTSTYKLVRRGQLVVGFPIDEGVLDFQSRYDEAMVSPAYGIWDLRDEDRVDRDYLSRYLRSPGALAFYRSKLRATTARRRSLPAELFLALPVYLPSLQEQRRVVAALNAIESTRDRIYDAAQGVNEIRLALGRRLFFADRKRAPLVSVSQRVNVGHVGPTSDYFASDGVPFLRTGNIGDGRVLTADMKYVVPDFHARLKKSQLAAGDVLISRVVGDSVRSAVLPADLAGSNCANIIIVSPGAELRGPVLVEYLRSSEAQRALMGRRVGSAQSVVNTKVLKEMLVPTPAVREQEEFCKELAIIGRLEARYERALLTVDALTASLQGRAFSGKL